MPRSGSTFRTCALAALALPFVLGACNDDPVSPRFPEDVDFAPSLNIDLDQMTRLSDGVFYEIVEEGPADEVPVASGEVLVDYALWLPDGTLLQTTFEDAASLDFVLGMGQVIPGFESGMLGGGGMKVGEVRRIVVPSELGYGANPPTNSGIPEQSVLIFDIELLSAAANEPV
jgi:FKBP-type peptidyl-prolyl cis-trans isomerase